MGLVRSQTIREGMDITGAGHDIKIRIDHIEGQPHERAVTFALGGIPGKYGIRLTPADGLVELIDGIKIAVSPRPPENKGEARINYDAPKSVYSFTKVEYERPDNLSTPPQ